MRSGPPTPTYCGLKLDRRHARRPVVPLDATVRSMPGKAICKSCLHRLAGQAGMLGVSLLGYGTVQPEGGER